MDLTQLSGEVEEAAQERREAEEKAKKAITDVSPSWGRGVLEWSSPRLSPPDHATSPTNSRSTHRRP